MSLSVQQTRAIVVGGTIVMTLVLASLAWQQIHAMLASCNSLFH
jgi:hypothetical protein